MPRGFVNITENALRTIKLKLQSETGMYKMCTEFTNTVCKFSRLLPIGHILNLNVCNYFKFTSSVSSSEIFSTKYRSLEVRLVHFHLK